MGTRARRRVGGALLVGCLLLVTALGWWPALPWGGPEGTTTDDDTSSGNPTLIGRAPPPVAGPKKEPPRETAEAAAPADRCVARHGRTGEVLRDVVVAVGSYDDESLEDVLYEHLELLFERGEVLKQDADGRFDLSKVQRPAVLLARAGSLRARYELWDETAELPTELILYPPLEIRVRVLDAEGAPAEGVYVDLRAPDTDPDADEPRSVVGGETDARGRVVLGEGDAWWEARNQHAMWIEAVIPAMPRRRVEIDVRAPPEDEVTLRLPPVGSLTVHVVDDEGAPFREPVVVNMEHPQFAGGAHFVHADDRRWAHLTESGEAHFAYVGLGVELGILVVLAKNMEAPGTPRLDVRTQVAGPVRAGQRVVTTVTIGKPKPVLVFRVAGLEQQAGGFWVEAVVEQATKERLGIADRYGMGPRSFGGYDAGVFTVHLEVERSELAGRAVGMILHGDTTTERVSVTLPEKLPDGVIDVGTLELEPRKQVLAGTVVDQDDKPVPYFQVRLERVIAEDETETIGTGTSDADGRFAIRNARAVEDGDELVVEGWQDGYVAVAPMPVRLGRTDVRIVLERAATLEGSFAVDEDLPWHLSGRVRLWIVGEPARIPWGQEFMGTWWYQLSPDDDGVFETTMLRPGTGTLRVIFDNSHVRTIEGIRLEAGKTCRDERLQAMAFPVPVTTRTLRLLDREGAVVLGAKAWYREPVRGVWVCWSNAECDHEGTVQLRGWQLDEAELWIHARGYEPAYWKALGERTELRLVPQIKASVQLQLRDGVRVPEAPISLEARVLWQPKEFGSKSARDLDVPWQEHATWGSFGPKGSLTLPVHQRGHHRIQLRLRHASTGWEDPTEHLETVSGPLRFDVTRDGQAHQFEVALDPDALAAAVEALLKQR